MKKKKITETSKEPPLTHFAGLMIMGSEAYITNQEKEGQREMVASEELPRDLNGVTEAELIAMGFVLPPSVKTDRNDIFRPAKLPEGWIRKPSDHAMWSYIFDARGFRRVSIFYKAAFYDRSAHMGVERRFHIREDFKAGDKDNHLHYYVEGQIPGGEHKKIFRMRSEEELPGRDVENYWEKREAMEAAARKACTDWLKEKYPDETKHWEIDL